MTRRPRNPLRRLARARSLRDVATLVSGTLGARLIGVLAIPLITRLFDPATFGQASFLVAVAATWNVGSSLAYDQAVILPASAREARQVSRLAWVLLAATTVLLVVGGAWLWPAAWQPGWLAADRGWWVLIASMALILGIGNIFTGWALRASRYGAIAASEFAESGCRAAGRIAWGATLGPGLTGLVAPHVAAIGLRVLVLLPRSGAAKPAAHAGAAEDAAPGTNPAPPAGSPAVGPTDTPADAVPAPRMLAVARRYANFPLLGLPSALMRALSERIPLLVLGAVFAPAVVGFYAAADRTIRAPVASFGKATRRVVLQRAVGRRHAGAPVLRVVMLGTLGLAALGAAPFLLLGLQGEAILAFALGDRWAETGIYAQAIAPWGFTLFCLGPAMAVFVALEQQRVAVVLSVIRLSAFGAVAFLVASRGFEPLAAVRGFSLAGAAANLLQILVGILMALRYDQRRDAGGTAGTGTPGGPATGVTS